MRAEPFRYRCGIGTGGQGFEFFAQLQIVINFAVEDDDGIAGQIWLVSRIEIDDFQPCRAKRYQIRFENALLVGTAMNTLRPRS